MENNLHVKVSLLKNKEDLAPKTVWLDEILSNEKYKFLVQKIRSITDETEQKKLKLKLPCFMPSCEIDANGKFIHTGIMCVDIDPQHNPDVSNFSDFKELARRIDCVAYCSLSARGQGFFALIPISNPNRHLEHFLSLKLDFARCGITIDPQCKNVNRLRFVTYDADPYINLNAKPYTMVLNPTKPVSVSYPDSPCIDRVEALIFEIENSVTDITEGYDAWFKIGCALANEFGEDGREYYQRVSAWSDQYEASNVDKQFNACLKSQKDSEKKIHIDTLFYYAKQFGVILNDPAQDFKN